MKGAKAILRDVYKSIPLTRNLFILLRSLYIPPRSVHQHLYFRGRFKVSIKGKHFYMVNHQSALETSVFWGGIFAGWEQESQRLWADLCKKSQTILDIGANTGLYSLIAKCVNPEAEVYSFEPIPRIYAKLTENCRINRFDIHHRSYAISNSDGESIIYDLPTDHHLHASLCEDELSHLNGELIKRKVVTKRLSTFITEEKIDDIHLMKIDVEGHEVEVLRGMGKYLEEMQPNILVEIKRDAVADEIEKLLENLDYVRFDIDEVEGPKMLTELRRSSAHNCLICDRLSARELDLITAHQIIKGEST